MRFFMVLLASSALMPVSALAQMGGTPKPGQGAPADKPKPQPQPASPGADTPEKPIVPDAEFEAALPKLSDDINAPLEQMAPPDPAAAPQPVEPIEDAEDLDAAGKEAEIAAPLPSIEQFDTTPVAEAAPANDEKAVEIRYATRVVGLEELGLDDQFKDLSALEDGDGRAANAAIIGARGREDEKLAVRLMRSLGYYDATAVATIEQTPGANRTVTAIITATPGPLYRLGSIKLDAGPTVPTSLIADNFKLKVGEPIDAVRVQAAEANVSLILPQNGYPFAEVGQRDILLDDETHVGDYTLPITTGARSSFGGIRTEGDPVFDTRHIGVLTRFRRDQLYDSRRSSTLRLS